MYMRVHLIDCLSLDNTDKYNDNIYSEEAKNSKIKEYSQYNKSINLLRHK